jgi:hypothetical protein
MLKPHWHRHTAILIIVGIYELLIDNSQENLSFMLYVKKNRFLAFIH